MVNERELYVPSARGRLVVNELTKVHWSVLQHAYGRGCEMSHYGHVYDVQAALAAVLSEPTEAHDEDQPDWAWDVMNSCLFHQGTVYEATIYALPFVLAFLCGSPDSEVANDLWYWSGCVLASASMPAAEPCYAGPFGDQVAEDFARLLRILPDCFEANPAWDAGTLRLWDAWCQLARADKPAIEAEIIAFEKLLDQQLGNGR